MVGEGCERKRENSRKDNRVKRIWGEEWKEGEDGEMKEEEKSSEEGWGRGGYVGEVGGRVGEMWE